MKLSEKDVTAQVLDLARHIGFEPIRLQAGVARGPKAGWITLGKKYRPDWLMVRPVSPGVCDAFFVEIKREKGGTLSPGQSVEHEQLRNRGFVVAVISSIEQMVDFVEANFA
jgi:hypothetical protein